MAHVSLSPTLRFFCLLGALASLGACGGGRDGLSDDGASDPVDGVPVGTGGTGGVVDLPGTGGGVTTPPTPSRVGSAILIQPDHSDTDPAPIGFAFGTRNQWGINGPAYTFHDDAGSTIEGYVPDPSKVCTYGTVAAVDTTCGVSPSCWAVYWGAGWGLNLNQQRHPAEGDPNEPLPLDLSGMDLVFDLTGEVPPYLWLTARVEGDDAPYCAAVQAGSNRVYLGNLRRNCWDEQEYEWVGARKIWAIQFHVATVPNAPIAFDYCVEGLALAHELLLK